MISVTLIMLGGLLAEIGAPQWVVSMSTTILGNLYAQFGPALQNRVSSWLWAAVKREGPKLMAGVVKSILSSGPPTDVLDWMQQEHVEVPQPGPDDATPGP